MSDTENLKTPIKLYFIPENKRDRRRPGIGAISLDHEKDAATAYPVLKDNYEALQKIGLGKVGQIDIYVMDTLEEAQAVQIGMREGAKKYTDCYQNTMGFGLVLMCNPALEHSINVTDFRKPAAEYGGTPDELVGSWKLDRHEYTEFRLSDEQIEAYQHRFGRRLSEMANSVTEEALEVLRDTSAEMVEENDQRFAASRGMSM